jgi:hypothetical protein
VDCGLLVRLHDMHVDCCTVIDFERYVIRELGEVESGNSGVQLSSDIVTRVMRQLDGTQTSPGTMFKEDYKGCY